jgi:hypothetical protein
MKNLIITSVLFLTIHCSLFSQTPDDYIDPENINVELMDSLMFSVVNRLRESKGLNTIEFDSVCYKSARYHNDYFLEHGKYSHDHTEYNKDSLLLKTPTDRINYFSEKYGKTGRRYGKENCTGWEDVSPQMLNKITYKEYVMDAMTEFYSNSICEKELVKVYKNCKHFGGTKFSYKKGDNGRYVLQTTFISLYKFDDVLN